MTLVKIMKRSSDEINIHSFNNKIIKEELQEIDKILHEKKKIQFTKGMLIG